MKRTPNSAQELATHCDLLDEREVEAWSGGRWRVRTLQAWRSRGRGPRYVKIGTGRSARVFYRMSDLEKFIDGCIVDPKGAA